MLQQMSSKYTIIQAIFIKKEYKKKIAKTYKGTNMQIFLSMISFSGVPLSCKKNTTQF